MSDLDKAIRAAADEANWFGLRNTLTAVLNELRQWDNEMPVVADRLRRIIAEPLGVSGDRSKPAPTPRTWRAGDPEPEDRPVVADNEGSRWEWRAEGDKPLPGYANQWHCLDDSGHMPWEFLARRWQPLTEVLSEVVTPEDPA